METLLSCKRFCKINWNNNFFKKDLTNYQIFNAGSNKNNYTKKSIGTKIKKLVGGKIKFLKKSKDKRNYIVDFSKVKKMLKFKPKYSVEYGIKEIFNKIRKENLIIKIMIN